MWAIYNSFFDLFLRALSPSISITGSCLMVYTPYISDCSRFFSRAEALDFIDCFCEHFDDLSDLLPVYLPDVLSFSDVAYDPFYDYLSISDLLDDDFPF